MNIILIAAKYEDHTIAVDGKIPWHLSSELQFFRSKTVNKPIIMGRNTADTLDKPLSHRINIVLSRDHYNRVGFKTATSIEEAFKLARGFNDIFIIGGGYVYQQFMDTANSIILSTIPGVYTGESKNVIKFPEISDDKWKITRMEYYDDFNVKYYVRK